MPIRWEESIPLPYADSFDRVFLFGHRDQQIHELTMQKSGLTLQRAGATSPASIFCLNRNNKMKSTFFVFALPVLTLSGCAVVDWHCTRGGQWSSYYESGDGRCTYFCADREEKYCASTPLMAEEKMRSAHEEIMAIDPIYIKALDDARKAQLETDKSFCHELGFKDSTDAMANCMLTQSQNRRMDSYEQRRSVQEANQRQLEKQQRDRDNAQRAVDKINEGKPITCTTIGEQTTCIK